MLARATGGHFITLERLSIFLESLTEGISGAVDSEADSIEVVDCTD